MKQLFTLIVLAFTCGEVMAQKDTMIIKKDTVIIKSDRNSDTIHLGKMIIIYNSKKNKKDTAVIGDKCGPKKRSNVSTNWLILDFGFANYIDKTNYEAATADGYLVNKPGSPDLSEGDFKLRTEKSVNVNIWFFMQRINLIKYHVFLKYGLGLELNNYRYRSEVNYNEGGPVPYSDPLRSVSDPFIFRDSILFSKNKLAADYITIPLLLNFSTNADDPNKGFGISIGVSGGYLYSQRNKQVSDERGKWTNRGQYGLQQFKFSYIAEIGLGPVRLYGSYSPNSMYEHSMEMRPYNLGLRLSPW